MAVKTNPIKLWDTAEMTPEEFTESRKKWLGGMPGIGGSDIGKILGVNKYSSVFDCYNEKLGLAPEKEGNESMNVGHIMEPRIAELFKAKMEEDGHKVEIYNDTSCYGCGEMELELDEFGDPIIDNEGNLAEKSKYPWARANLDRIAVVDGTPTVLEIKTIDADNYTGIKEWKNGFVPISYEWQVRFYLAVMNLSQAYIICAWGFKKKDSAIIKIERDLELEDYMLDTVDKFARDFLVRKIEPDITDFPINGEQAWKYYEEKYGVPEERQDRIELPSDYISLAKEYNEIQEKIATLEAKTKALRDKQQLIEAKFLDKCKGHEYASVEISPTQTANINMPFGKKTVKFDVKKVMEDFPDCVDFLAVEATKFRKAHKSEAAKYELPKELSGTRKFELKIYEHKAI